MEAMNVEAAKWRRNAVETEVIDVDELDRRRRRRNIILIVLGVIWSPLRWHSSSSPADRR
jgi:hypothetical protein